MKTTALDRVKAVVFDHDHLGSIGDFTLPDGRKELACGQCLNAMAALLEKADARIAELENALQAVKEELQCCASMTLEVPADSIKAGIPHCPYHGRHRQPAVFKALVAIRAALEVSNG